MEPEVKKEKINLKRLFITIGIVFITAFTVGGSVWYVMNKQNNANLENENNITSSNSETKTDQKKASERVKKIYYTENNKIYSVNPLDKKIEEIDNGVDSQSGSTGYGSNSPLMSNDQLKVAYIKNDEIWLKEDGSPQKKIDQPTPKKTDGYYDWWISGWSSDSKNFTYSISFSCGMGAPGCDETDEDKTTTGFYWYSLSTSKSTKLPLSRIDLWLPNSNKIVFFEKVNNVNHLKTYDVFTKQTSQLTTTGWSGLEPQIAFSDDGKKMIYSYGEPSGSYSKIIIADPNNEHQIIEKQGVWAEYQWPRFIKGSISDYVYSHSEGWNCPDGGTGCPAMILYSVINKKTSKITGIISHITGFNSDGQVIAITGYVYDKAKKKTLSLINASNQAIINLYEGKELLDSKMGWQ